LNYLNAIKKIRPMMLKCASASARTSNVTNIETNKITRENAIFDDIDYLIHGYSAKGSEG